MKKKLIIISISILLTLISGLLLIAKIYSYNQPEIHSIYVYHSSFGIRDTEYYINILNKELLAFYSEDFEERDTTLPNSGYTFVSTLDDEKLETFRLDSIRYGFTDWKKTYIDNGIADGHQWGVVITFVDPSIEPIVVFGSNKYPKTYDNMSEAFKHLTGLNIL